MLDYVRTCTNLHSLYERRLVIKQIICLFHRSCEAHILFLSFLFSVVTYWGCHAVVTTPSVVSSQAARARGQGMGNWKMVKTLTWLSPQPGAAPVHIRSSTSKCPICDGYTGERRHDRDQSYHSYVTFFSVHTYAPSIIPGWR